MLRMSVILSALLLAAPALAGGPPADPTRISQEFISPMGEPFRAASAAPYPSDAWFKQADANGDGVITRAEFQADALRFFRVLDKDGDGIIDDAEISVYENDIAPEVKLGINADIPEPRGGSSDTTVRGSSDELPQRYVHSVSRIDEARQHDAEIGKGPRRELPPRRGAGMFSYFDEPEPVRADDRNIDFRVSLTEWIAAADRRFDALDTKHNGKLEASELPITPFEAILMKKKR